MSSKTNIYRDFLLGKLPEAEREAIEDLFIDDHETFEAMEAAESDLLDEWVRGELAESDREALDRAIAASPRLAERARVARVLVYRADAESVPVPEKQTGGLRAWLLAASLTGLALLSWWTSSLDTGEIQAEDRVARVLLLGETLRSQTAFETVVLAESHEKLVLEIDLGEVTLLPPYGIVLEGPAEADGWASPSLEPVELDWGTILRVEIPAEALTEGEYQVGLRRGIGDSAQWLAFYTLQIEKPSH